MKLQIKETREKKIFVDLNNGNGPSALRSLVLRLSCSEFIAALRVIPVEDPTFDMSAALTGTPMSGPEMILHAVSHGLLRLLDYIFDTKLVSPDFITSNGSPLILYAMQHSWETFLYVLSRGARLFKAGDFVRNQYMRSVTVFSCAVSDLRILNYLWNVLCENSGLKVMNYETLSQGLCLGVSLGRPQSELKHYVTLHGLGIRVNPRPHVTRIDTTPPESPRGKLMALVSAECTDHDRFKSIQGLDSSDIIWATFASLGHADNAVYRALFVAFPHVHTIK